MKKIKEFKISLMEKDLKNLPTKEQEEKNRKNYIVRSSGTFKLQEFLDKSNLELNEEEYEDFIFTSAELIYNNLINISSKNIFDSVGIWIIFDNEEELDNSIDINVFNDIKKYGAEDIIPIKEFVKMTLKNKN